MMRIGFVARGLTQGGTARFVTNILREFDLLAGQELSGYVFTDEPSWADRFMRLQVVYLPRFNKLVWDYVLLPRALFRHKLDVVFYPKNVIPLSHGLLPARKVNIIHDLAHFAPGLEAYPFWDSLYMKLLMKWSCWLAGRVVAVSDFTKSEIVRILGVRPEKIAVINEGVEEDFKRVTDNQVLQAVVRKYNLKLPFMFYCGSISPRKNILRLLQAFDYVQNEIPHQLYLVAGRAWGDRSVREFLARHVSARVQVLDFLPQADLITLYSLADAYLYPSLYEGFGLPILEAQACGCPVLTSNSSPMSEVGGEAVLAVDPRDVAEITRAMLRLAREPDLRGELIQRGYSNVRRFSWKTSASKLLQAGAAT